MNKSLQAVPPTIVTTGLQGPCSSLLQLTGLIPDCPSYDSGFKKMGSTLTWAHHFTSLDLSSFNSWSGPVVQIRSQAPLHPPIKNYAAENVHSAEVLE